MANYHRPLDNNIAVENFLKLTLQFDYTIDPALNDIVSLIVDGEIGVSKFMPAMQTYDRPDMRNAEYRDEEDRWELRRTIINELWTKTRLAKDDEITLQNGGALPNSDLKCEKQVFILTGLPASGKSTIATKIADDYGAIIIDSDYAKRKLPEYKKHLYGASIVHKESTRITHSFLNDNPKNLQSLMDLSIEKGCNIIIPTIGESPDDIIKLASNLKNNKQYDVHLILVYLPQRDATIRALYRYVKSERYVPLALIYDGYGNDPACCYFYLRTKHAVLFKSMGALLTESKHAEQIDVLGSSPVLQYQFKDIILRLS